MFHLHRTALSAGLVTTLALAVSAAPAALAQRNDLRSPDTRDAAAAIRTATDLRNPDARHADAGGRIVAAGPPTWPLTPQPLNRPRSAVSAPPTFGPRLELGGDRRGRAACGTRARAGRHRRSTPPSRPATVADRSLMIGACGDAVRASRPGRSGVVREV
jgi:hypothetical protein